MLSSGTLTNYRVMYKVYIGRSGDICGHYDGIPGLDL